MIIFLKSKITSQVHMFYFINVIFKRRVCYRSKVISGESFLTQGDSQFSLSSRGSTVRDKGN